MTSRTVITTIALSAACAAFSVAAQQREAMKACQADVKAYCANIERGEGRLGKCLKENEDKVSAGCKTQMQKMASRMQERRGEAGGAASAPSN